MCPSESSGKKWVAAVLVVLLLAGVVYYVHARAYTPIVQILISSDIANTIVGQPQVGNFKIVGPTGGTNFGTVVTNQQVQVTVQSTGTVARANALITHPVEGRRICEDAIVNGVPAVGEDDVVVASEAWLDLGGDALLKFEAKKRKVDADIREARRRSGLEAALQEYIEKLRGE